MIFVALCRYEPDFVMSVQYFEWSVITSSEEEVLCERLFVFRQFFCQSQGSLDVAILRSKSREPPNIYKNNRKLEMIGQVSLV